MKNLFKGVGLGIVAVIGVIIETVTSLFLWVLFGLIIGLLAQYLLGDFIANGLGLILGRSIEGGDLVPIFTVISLVAGFFKR